MRPSGGSFIRRWTLALELAGVAGLLGLFACGFTTAPRAIPSTLPGKPAPDFSLTRVEGKSRDSESISVR
jgi:hypothetical protein